MLRNLRKYLSVSLMFILIIQVTDALSKEIPYKVIEIKNISRYNEDRLVFQHIETEPIEYKVDKTDNSIAALLIVKDKKMYLFKDGYDNPQTVETRRLILEMESRLIPDLWVNKIDGLPDFMRITDRRIELQKKIVDPTKEDSKSGAKSLGGKFDKFYKNIRDKLILKHLQIFKTLMINRKESGLYVVRKPLPKRVYDRGPTKYFISVSGKTIDGKLYYAEDADGDGITETFSVTIPDGFHWGYKSGPNILLIYHNKQEDLKKLIGHLTRDAYYGTAEEAKAIEKSFFGEEEINDMIDDIYRMSPEQKKLLKSE